MADVVKFCPYCLRPHDRRARACSDWCERRIRGKAAYVTRSRKQACARIMARVQARLRYVPQWRRLAMGDDTQLQAIFGTEPSTEPHRHGEYIDA